MAAAAADDARGAAARLEAIWRDGGPAQWLLRPLALLHAALVGLRRALYRAGLRRRERLPVPVIVVGNRVAGGAGKTPVTIALVQALRQAGRRPGIVSRGHGRSHTGTIREVQPADTAADSGDEPLLMRRRTGAPVVVGRDRAAAARELLARHPDTDVIVCDDGLQHLRLARDIEIVVFDERGAGNGWLLPAGPLREPVDAPPAGRVQLVVLNTDRTEPPPGAPPGERSRRQLGRPVPLADWWRGTPSDTALTDEAAWAALRGRRLLASAGTGQPARFFDALRAHGLEIDTLALDDHHDHMTLPWPASATEVLVTEKDAVKLDPARLAAERPGLQVQVVPLELQLPAALIAAVLQALPAR
ncbi:tetraacyldisaccharide 4'-kinase [Sphaerotilus uruguayifluvii]|uniref:Tetraacyldisaccharide 4'-kinase n=1 Tax=Sphaerotilus uruguayifluvii TaxID=2735897 RepID=A0ABX2G037_9BURK|nr:tetraacyldisaccharide 4'-kinase [Leptothrix sp. C29]